MSHNVVRLSDSTTFYSLGKWFYKQKYYHKSIQYLEKAVQINPDCLKSHSLLTEVYSVCNHNEKALKHLEKLIQINKNDWTLKKSLIKLYLKDKKYNKASALLKERFHWIKGDLSWWKRLAARITKNIDIKVEYTRSLFQLTYALREEEQFNQAVKFGKKLCRLKNDTVSHYLLATVYEDMSDYQNAQKEFAKITEQYMPINPQFYEHLYTVFKENLIIHQVGT